MGKTKLITAIVLSIGMLSVTAQYNFDFGIRLGGSNYLGDIGGKEKTRRDFVMDMKLNQTRWVFGGFARYKFASNFAGNLSVNYGRIQGDDALSTNLGRRTRNLRFQNNILDITARGEYYFFEVNDVGNHGRYWVDMKVYAHGGLTAFHHNPKGSLDGSTWVPLQPLETEGVHYSKWGLGIPAGLGLYFTFKRKHRIGWDFSWTTTFTDYLDDISTQYADKGTGTQAALLANQSANVTSDEALLANFQPGSKRGDPTHNDSYLFTTLSYSYLIRGQSNFYRQSYGWLSGKKKSVRKVRAKF